ncbi:SDR family NAD(P)-dependent oxidoreductase [Luteibacter aegosomatissinici]|uniref:SDR family NAD(P)-dependent oxidoreductase n=1 Tax=Luteibacter aegosomatissinici TaxID=2911539 RepID=UPI001FFA0F57|nr:SDR family NAD(P)-dependent oxidoreductase [Luteibacter aegosomatissinici]UPG92565.1 SDR family NAD(P)-dependent oxidoreductase [Luteibacter aegosomatissinici]
MPSPFRTAVITSAASGLGMACAEHLAREGYGLILVDTERNVLNTLAEALTTRTRCAVEVVAADVGCPWSLPALAEHLRLDASIAVVVCITHFPERVLDDY